MKKYLLLAVVSLLFAFAGKGQEVYPPIPALKAQLHLATSDTARLGIMIKLADTYAEASAENPHATDTAFQYLYAIRDAAATGSNPWLKGWYHLVAAKTFQYSIHHEPLDSAVYHIGRALATLQPYRLDWGKACMEAASIYTDGRNAHEDSLQVIYYKNAVAVFDSVGAKPFLASALEYLGVVLRNSKESIPVLLRAVEIYKSLPKPDLRTVYSGLAKAYAMSGDLQQALSFALLAVRQDESRPAPDQTSVLVYNKLADCYNTLGDYKQAALNFGRSLELAVRVRDTGAIHLNAGSQIICDLNQGDYAAALAVQRRIVLAFPPSTNVEKIEQAENFARIFQKLDKVDSMGLYVHQLTRMDAQLSSNDFYRDYTLPMMIGYANRTGQYLSAQKYARELLRLGRALNVMGIIRSGYGCLATADSGLGNYKTAMGEYEQYIRLRDSLRDVNNTKQIASLNLQYETEKKDKDISSLNHQQQLSTLALRQASLTRNFIIGGAILLLILLAVAINRNRLKQRTNKKLEAQQAEIGEQNIALRHLVKEKDWLVKEVHHRVKNNLQIVMSLLNSQSAYIDNEHALTAIHESQHRVHAMSLIHQKLYNSENVASIDMLAYIRELVSYLGDSFNTGQRIRFELNIERLEMDVSQAVPLGLILNEAITNSIKYAFPDDRKGTITVELSKDSATHYFLCVADNGIGIPTRLASKKPGSLGMSLMAGLSADLDGTFSIENKNGTVVKISFIFDPDISRPHPELPTFATNK